MSREVRQCLVLYAAEARLSLVSSSSRVDISTISQFAIRYVVACRVLPLLSPLADSPSLPSPTPRTESHSPPFSPPLSHQRSERFVAGMCTSLESRDLKGDTLTKNVVESIGFILHGMNLASASPRHAFLVLNGSHAFWNVSWPLHRQGLRHHVLDATERVVSLLTGLPGQDERRARLSLALARCFHEASRPDDALRTLAEAKKLALAADNDALVQEIVQY